MEKEVVAAIVGALGGLGGGIVAAWVTLRAKGIDRLIEDRKMLIATYDAKLLDERLLSYKALWMRTEKTSRRHVRKMDFAGCWCTRGEFDGLVLR